MDNGLALFQPELLKHAVEFVGTENPHQIILQRQEEFRCSRVALATGPAAKLIVDAP